MENNFEKVMSERTDEELIKIVTIEREDYQPLAIETAENEIKNRKLDINDFQEVKQDAIIEKEKNIKTKSNVANSGLRFLNFIIDSFAFMTLGFILSIAFGLITFILNIELNPNNYTLFQIIGIAMYFIAFMIYYVLLETKYQKTLGKFLTKTKVTYENGEKPDLNTIIARTLYRLIPFDRLSFIFLKNGIHDMISKTIVIKIDKNN